MLWCDVLTFMWWINKSMSPALVKVLYIQICFLDNAKFRDENKTHDFSKSNILVLIKFFSNVAFYKPNTNNTYLIVAISPKVLVHAKHIKLDLELKIKFYKISSNSFVQILVKRLMTSVSDWKWINVRFRNNWEKQKVNFNQIWFHARRVYARNNVRLDPFKYLF